MTLTTSSRLSLADLNLLIANSNLEPRARADLRSAVNTVARVLGADPALVPADPGALRRRLEAVAPAAHGLSGQRWANVRSLLGRALALARPVMPSRTYTPLLPDWAALLDGLSRNRRDQLQAMLRHLSAQEVGPWAVGMQHLEAYRDAILNDRLRGGAEQTWDGITWAWNKCSREVAGWPDLKIPRPSRKVTYVLPWSAFPPSLQAEVTRFLDRQSGRDLSEDGPGRPLRATSLKTREYQLRVAASALVAAGVPAASIGSFADLLGIEAYRKILQVLLDRAGGKPSPQAGQIARFLVSVARHWLKADDETLLRMGRLAKKVGPELQKGMTEKNRERLRPFDDDETVGRLLALPEQMRREIGAAKTAPARKAIEAQKAVAIAILLVVPVRLRNLVNIDLEKNLVARRNRLYLVVPEHKVKNSQPIDFELPEDVADLISWYVREHRPHLLKDTSSTALFPGRDGRPKFSGTLGLQISQAVFAYTGLTVNPHLFRHIAAKLYLDRRPGDYVTVQRVLGHRSLATTSSIYTGMETRAAGRHFVGVVREALAKAPRGRS